MGLAGRCKAVLWDTVEGGVSWQGLAGLLAAEFAAPPVHDAS